MKKRLLCGMMAAFTVFMLTACDSREAPKAGTAAVETEVETETETETEAAAYEIPKGFTDGYAYGDPEVYMDQSSVEAALGTHIWIDGAITELATTTQDNVYFGVALIQTEEGDNWVAILGKADEEIEDKKYSYNYNQNGMCIDGVLSGWNSDLNCPILITHKAFFVATGETSDGIPDYEYTATTSQESTADTSTDAQKNSESASSGTASSGTASSESKASASGSTKTDENGVSADFKKTMDDYEAFFDEYIEFMNKYSSSSDTMSMYADYLKYLTKYTELMSDMENIDESTLSAADDAYYLEVMTRIEKKLLEAAY